MRIRSSQQRVSVHEIAYYFVFTYVLVCSCLIAERKLYFKYPLKCSRCAKILLPDIMRQEVKMTLSVFIRVGDPANSMPS